MKKEVVVDVYGSVFATIACTAIVVTSFFGIGAIVVSILETITRSFK